MYSYNSESSTVPIAMLRFKKKELSGENVTEGEERSGCVAMSAVKQLLPRTKISLLLSSNTKSNSNC